MSWDMKSLNQVLKEGFDVPKGRIAITTHIIEAWSGDINTNYWNRRAHKIPAGTIVMIMDVQQNNMRNRVAKVFHDGQQVNVDAVEQLFMVNPENKFDNLAFAVTGTLSKQREFYKSLIKFKGGTWKNAVSNNTDILVVGKNNRGENSTKYKKAVSLKIRIIDEDNLRQLLHQ